MDDPDAAAYLSLARVLSSSSRVNKALHDGSFASWARADSQLLTKGNVLGLMLCYVPAVGVRSASIAAAVEAVAMAAPAGDRGDDDDPGDLGDLGDLVGLAAADLARDTAARCARFGLNTNESDPQALLFGFVAAKVKWSSSYVDDFGKFEPFLSLGALAQYAPFEAWRRGVLAPFARYAQSANVSYSSFVDAPYVQQFALLAEALEPDNCRQWLSQVMVPLVQYHRRDLGLLNQLLFESGRSLVDSYHLWGEALQAVALASPPLAPAAVEPLVASYVRACYTDPWPASGVEAYKVHTSVQACLAAVQPVAPGCAAAVGELLDIVRTCARLQSTTSLSVQDYVHLKQATPPQRQKEVVRILSGANDSNWELVLDAVETFFTAFIPDAEREEVWSLVANRLLSAGLFGVVDTLYRDGRLPLSSRQYFAVLLSKFWEFFNSATNLNAKIGRLSLATQVVPLFDACQAERHEVVRIKHLLKALSNMKNFKIVIERGVPVTPQQVVKHYSTVTSDDHSPMDLVALILAQNQKSYLAYEKLYRILNDLIVFARRPEGGGDGDESNQIARLKSACVEAALIDNNFDFAYTKAIELFEHCSSDEILARTWLTLYQVGKWVSPSWFDDGATRARVDVMLKQREVLAMLLQAGRSAAADNSRLIAHQIARLNHEIDEWYEHEAGRVGADLRTTDVHDATHTAHQASDKLSSLFVSGLGWAIGAQP
ncbi:Sec39 domain-containing protein [[Candida] zeylanoides]